MLRPSSSTLSALLVVVIASAVEVLDGPASPSAQPAWLANLTSWRASTVAHFGLTSDVLNTYLPWTPRLFVAPQVHIYDRFLYDREAGIYTTERFLADLEARYGGVDGVLLWATYPNMGVDEVNQFDLLSTLPGGLAGFKAGVIDVLHANGVKAGLPYNPWDLGTQRPQQSDPQSLSALGAALGADFVNGDTMTFMDQAFFTDSVQAGNPLALQPEGGPTYQSVNYTSMGWGYWPNPDPFVPPLGLWKFLSLGLPDLNLGASHMTQICNRWSQNHTTDLQQAFFNGIGFVSWENVWGIWNGLTDRDAEATRRFGALSRFFGGFLTSQGWEPHTVLDANASGVGIFASRWPMGAGEIFSNNATFWTVVNRGSLNYSGPVVLLDCTTADNFAFFDAYRGVAVTPVQAGGGGCALPLEVEAEGFSAVIGLDPLDVNPDLTAFLAEAAARTARPLASYSTTVVVLQQVMDDFGTTPPASAAPPNMTYCPGSAGWTFAVTGTEIEPFSPTSTPGLDVQFPWESTPVRTHAPHSMPIPPFFIDTVPVTNDAYAAFLGASGYRPTDTSNFLRDWNCSSASCTYPTGWGAKPVTWVSIEDSAAFCGFAGKRLPNDWEWQYAAQGTAGTASYPWGDAWDATRVPAQNTSTVRPAPPDVGQFPSGASPFGVLDLMGLVWQWTNAFTDDHTRAGLVRGGAYFAARTTYGENWYFPGSLSPSGDVRANTHNKLLLMSESYDRHGTVGFRCVVDKAVTTGAGAGGEGGL
jgi:gamma-glutamyl hercynylcysteine S-oxide synthase